MIFRMNGPVLPIFVHQMMVRLHTLLVFIAFTVLLVHKAIPHHHHFDTGYLTEPHKHHDEDHEHDHSLLTYLHIDEAYIVNFHLLKDVLRKYLSHTILPTEIQKNFSSQAVPSPPDHIPIVAYRQAFLAIHTRRGPPVA